MPSRLSSNPDLGKSAAFNWIRRCYVPRSSPSSPLHSPYHLHLIRADLTPSSCVRGNIPIVILPHAHLRLIQTLRDQASRRN